MMTTDDDRHGGRESHGTFPATCWLLVGASGIDVNSPSEGQKEDEFAAPGTQLSCNWSAIKWNISRFPNGPGCPTSA